MIAKNQPALEAEMNDVVGNLENRVVQINKSGLRYYTGPIRDILKDMIDARKSKDHAIYGEIMQMETLAKEVKDSKQSTIMVKKIQKIKAMINAACLCLICFNADLPFRAVHGRARCGTARTAKIVRKEASCA